jgi:hypothetical protein
MTATYSELVAYGRALLGRTMTDDYEALVAAGKAAVKTETGTLWAIGDLACQVETSYGEGKLQQYAQDIDVEYSTLQERRRVSARWPKPDENLDQDPKSRRSGLSWSVHHIFAARGDRFELIDRYPTVRKARAFLGQKVPLNQRPQTVEEKADLAKELLDEPEVARAALTDPAMARKVVDDPVVSSRLSQARQEVSEEREEKTTARERTEHPTSWRQENFYRAQNSLDTARAWVNRALDALREVDINDERRALLTEDIQAVEVSLEWLKSYVSSGDRSFDAELENLLKGGAQ